MITIPVRPIILALLLLVPSFAISVDIVPNHVRMPVGSNQTLEIQMVGDGKLYELKIYGAYLNWQTQKTWVGPMGKSTHVIFSPLEEGEFTITADLGGVQGEATATVYAVSQNNILERIREFRAQVLDADSLAILEEAERLYNESRFELAEMELNKIVPGDVLAETQSDFPKVFLVALIAVAAIVAAKLLLG